MGIRRLSKGPNQPFYNVLGDDGSCRYAAQGKFTNEGLKNLSCYFYINFSL